MEELRTVEKTASAELTEKKSVFIGTASPVKTEAEARDFIASVKKKYSDACHNVSAYIIDGGIMHSSDDGEPSGTAGVPVLEVIKKCGITNVAVVVTRYFGGILLGAGGLVRAYSAAAKLAVDASNIVTYEKFFECRIKCSYADYNDVIYRLSQFCTKLGKTEFGSDVTLDFSVWHGDREKCENEIISRFDSKYSVTVTGEKFDVK